MLYPPQLLGIQPALKDPSRRFILNWEQGCGKSVGTCEIINQTRPARILVICPAIVRRDWAKAAQKFISSNPTVGIHRVGPGRKGLTKAQAEEAKNALDASFQIVSADLACHHVRAGFWDLIVLDELHLYKNENAARSQDIRQLLQVNPQAMVLGLTGTLAPNDLGDIWHPIDLLWPGRMGQKYAFQHRYQNKTLKIINEQTGETRAKFVGLRQEHAEELAYRLSKMSTRVTRGDVAEFLPPFDIKLLHLDIAVDWTTAGTSKQEIEEALEKAARAKVTAVVDWVALTKETTTHVAVLAHHKEVAETYADALAKKLPLEKIVHVDGDIPADRRMQMIEDAKEMPAAILVGTIQSLGLGISLTKFTQAVCVEYHWSPGVTEQVLLRFSRLDSMIPSAVWFAFVPGTIDEVIATRLEEKFTAINPVATAGVVGSKLEGLLKVDEAAFLEDITKAAMQLETGGGYL